MNEALAARLNRLLPRIISEEFLKATGIGNEIAFHIFDYPAEDELQIRDYLHKLPMFIAQKNPALCVKHINLFDFVLGYLSERKLLEKAIKLQNEKGDSALMAALKGPLHENKIAPYFAELAQPQQHDLIILSGVGSVWPLLRSHTLLNNLHPIMGQTPLVLFYPGRYDGQSLRLFGKLKSSPYYRAFKLLP